MKNANDQFKVGNERFTSYELACKQSDATGEPVLILDNGTLSNFPTWRELASCEVNDDED